MKKEGGLKVNFTLSVMNNSLFNFLYPSFMQFEIANDYTINIIHHLYFHFGYNIIVLAVPFTIEHVPILANLDILNTWNQIKTQR